MQSKVKTWGIIWWLFSLIVGSVILGWIVGRLGLPGIEKVVALPLGFLWGCFITSLFCR